MFGWNKQINCRRMFAGWSAAIEGALRQDSGSPAGHLSRFRYIVNTFG